MDKAQADLLKDRFVRAIQKSFSPCPLIGDKWFVPNSEGVDYQFVGCGKLAKAMGSNEKYIAQTIVKNLQFGDVDASIEIAADCKINVRLSTSGE